MAAHVPDDGDVRRDTTEDLRLAAYIQGWMDEAKDLGVVAMQEGRAVGAVWARQWSERRHGYVWLPGEHADLPELIIAVEPGLRGTGTGAALIRALQEAAGPRFGGLTLNVRDDNPAARLYRRMGFSEVGRIPNRVGGESLVLVWTMAAA